MLPGMSASDSPQAIFSSSLCTIPNIILLQQGKNFILNLVRIEMSVQVKE